MEEKGDGVTYEKPDAFLAELKSKRVLEGNELAGYLNQKIDSNYDQIISGLPQIDHLTKRLWLSTPDSLKNTRWLSKTPNNPTFYALTNIKNDIFNSKQVVFSNNPQLPDDVSGFFVFEDSYFPFVIEPDGAIDIHGFKAGEHPELSTLVKADAILRYSTCLNNNKKLSEQHYSNILSDNKDALDLLQGGFRNHEPEPEEQPQKEDIEVTKRRLQSLEEILSEGKFAPIVNIQNLISRRAWNQVVPRLRTNKWMEKGLEYRNGPYTNKESELATMTSILRDKGARFTATSENSNIDFAIEITETTFSGQMTPSGDISFDEDIFIDCPNIEQFVKSSVVSNYFELLVNNNELTSEKKHERFKTNAVTEMKKGASYETRQEFKDLIDKAFEENQPKSLISENLGGVDAIPPGTFDDTKEIEASEMKFAQTFEAAQDIQNNGTDEAFSEPAEEPDITEKIAFVPNTIETRPNLETMFSKIRISGAERKQQIVDELVREALYNRTDYFSVMQLTDMGLRLRSTGNKADQKAGEMLFDRMQVYFDDVKQKIPILSKVAFPDPSLDNEGRHAWATLLEDVGRHVQKVEKNPGNERYVKFVMDELKFTEGFSTRYTPNWLIMQINYDRLNSDEISPERVQNFQIKSAQILHDINVTKNSSNEIIELLGHLSARPENKDDLNLFLSASFGTTFTLKDILETEDSDKAQQEAIEFCDSIPQGDYVWHELTDMLLKNNLQLSRRIYSQSKDTLARIPRGDWMHAPSLELESSIDTGIGFPDENTAENDERNKKIYAKLDAFFENLSDEEKEKVFRLSDEVRIEMWQHLPDVYKSYHNLDEFDRKLVAKIKSPNTLALLSPFDLFVAAVGYDSVSKEEALFIGFGNEDSQELIRFRLDNDGTMTLPRGISDTVGSRSAKFIAFFAYFNLLKIRGKIDDSAFPQSNIAKENELESLINKAALRQDKSSPNSSATDGFAQNAEGENLPQETSEDGKKEDSTNLISEYSHSLGGPTKEQVVNQLIKNIDGIEGPELILQYLDFGFTRLTAFDKRERQDGRRLLESLESYLSQLEPEKRAEVMKTGHEFMEQNKELPFAISRKLGQARSRHLATFETDSIIEFLLFGDKEELKKGEKMQQRNHEQVNNYFSFLTDEEKEKLSGLLDEASKRTWELVPKQYRTSNGMSPKNENNKFILQDKTLLEAIKPLTDIAIYRDDKEAEGKVIAIFTTVNGDEGIATTIDSDGKVKWIDFDEGNDLASKFVQFHVLNNYLFILATKQKLKNVESPRLDNAHKALNLMLNEIFETPLGQTGIGSQKQETTVKLNEDSVPIQTVEEAGLSVPTQPVKIASVDEMEASEKFEVVDVNQAPLPQAKPAQGNGGKNGSNHEVTPRRRRTREEIAREIEESGEEFDQEFRKLLDSHGFDIQ